MDRPSLEANLKLCMLLFLAIGCGVEIGNPKNPDGEETKNNAGEVFAVDSDAAAELVSMQIDSTTASLSEEDASSTVSTLKLMTSSFTDESFVRDAECSASDGEAVVNVSVSGEVSREIGNRPLFKRTLSATEKTSRKTTWSSENQDIGCHSGGKWAAVDFRNLEEVTRNVEFSRERTVQIHRQISGKLLRDFYFKAEGERRFVFTKVSTSDSDLRRLKSTVSSDVSREFKYETPKSGKLEISTDISTETSDPLVILHGFSTDDGSWVEKSIESGTLRSTQADESYFLSEYESVVYTPQSGCQPESGSITGKFYADEASDEPTRTYVVSFSEDGATITFDNGDVKVYEADSCEFDER